MAGVAVLIAAAGCGGSAVRDVSVARPTGGTTKGCAAVIAALPDRVDDQTRRRTTGYAAAAAWGDPAIVVRCGVPRGQGYTQTAACQTVNGVDWYLPSTQVGDASADTVFTLLHRTPRVEVRVPAHYRPQGPGNALADLASAIKKSTKKTGHCA